MQISIAVQSQLGLPALKRGFVVKSLTLKSLLLIQTPCVRPAWPNPDLTLQTDLSLEQLTSHPSVI